MPAPNLTTDPSTITAVAALPTAPSFTPNLLTLIITTSPTPSAPSTELLETIILSFRKHCPDLTECRVILVIDTYDHVAPHGKHARLKKGVVTAEGAKNHADYATNAKAFILNEFSQNSDQSDDDDQELIMSIGRAEFGCTAYAHKDNAVPFAITETKDGRVTFIEPMQRLGFGLAVRSALRLTKTPYVWVQQHDWSLVYDIPLAPLLDIMQESEPEPEPEPKPEPEPELDSEPHQTVHVPVKYVCFPAVRMLQYANSPHVMDFPALRGLTSQLKQDFTSQSQLDADKIPLTPLFFWHDKPHIASTEHYLVRVFPNRLAMLRGAFIEDTAGHRARTDMKDGLWAKWACWLYYPDEGKQLCVRHLKGRTWRGAEAELSQKLEWLRLNGRES
ncbi:hypothetical protein B0T22DRAFT_386548 [Podospora appendiculata]|uniref:Uncharacterized protein n=1 Tax=Podospora appendiculata TaxID=314037 RepID=A0AAE0X0H5_9PEZI|nr:hypothetical protein B0T22DRAFT_386548 [Podospora appendiculata]